MLGIPQLNPALDLPLYRQLYDFVKVAIEKGELRAGDRLPATRELAGQLGLNRTTVSAAYELLEGEGWIRGHVGRGSFVAGPQPAADALISFTASRPAAEAFPLADIRRTADEVLSGPEASAILQLGAPHGYAPLRDYLLGEARRSGDAAPGDDILITSGCQQAIDLLHRVLASSGETVAIEDPVYPGLRNVFQQDGARPLALPVDMSGLDIAAAVRILTRERPVLAVIAPEFQNPTGSSLGGDARQALAEAARRAAVRLVENDIYGGLRFDGEAPATLKRLDPEAGTVLLRSFSKLAFPGLRVGWVIAPRDLIRRLAEAKRWSDLHTDQLSQAVMLRFAQSGRLAAHRARVIRDGAARRDAAVAACAAHLPAGSKFSRPAGGMHLWVRLPGGIDAAETLPKAEGAGVSYLPGSYFSVAQNHSDALRLSFAGVTPDRIGKGIAILGAVLEQQLARAPEPALV